MAQLRRRKEIPFGLAHNCIQILALEKKKNFVRRSVPFTSGFSNLIKWFYGGEAEEGLFREWKTNKAPQLGSRHDMEREENTMFFKASRNSYLWTYKQKQTILDAAGHCWWISSTNTRSLAFEWSDNQLRGRSMFQTNFNRGRFNMSLTLRSQHPTSVDTFRFEGSGSTSLHVFEDGHRGWVERISNRKLTLMNHFFPTSNTTWCPLNVLLAQFFPSWPNCFSSMEL